MLRLALITAVLASVLACPAFAADSGRSQDAPATSGSTATTAAEPAPKELEEVEREEQKVADMESRWDENVIVCKSMRMSGSRQRKRVCHSRGEWEAMRANAEDTIRYIDSQPRLVPRT